MTDSPNTRSIDVPTLIGSRLQPRLPLLNPNTPKVVRLFNGHTEGLPGWVVDLYATNLVISQHTPPDSQSHQTADQIAQTIQSQLPWSTGVLFKQRRSTDEEVRKGQWLTKSKVIRDIVENGVRYAIDLRLNQDNSF